MRKPQSLRFARQLSFVGCCCILLGLAGCSDSEADAATDPMSVGSDLRVRASIGQPQGSARSLVLGNSFGEGARIGVTVTKPDGSAYTGPSNYTNVAYTSVGTVDAAGGQTWIGNEMKIKEPAWAVAYYPYEDGKNSVYRRMYANTQTDYMYSGWVKGLSADNPQAQFNMKHALAAIRINFRRGDYDPSKPCRITSVGAYSMGFCTEGSLDITTGEIYRVYNIGEFISTTTDFDLPTDKPDCCETAYVLVVPAGTDEIFKATARVVVDGLTFSAPIAMTTPFEQGRIYSIDMEINKISLGVGTVQVFPWTETYIDGSVTEQ